MHHFCTYAKERRVKRLRVKRVRRVRLKTVKRVRVTKGYKGRRKGLNG